MKDKPITLKSEQWNRKELVVGRAYLLYDKIMCMGQHVMLRKIYNEPRNELEFVYPIYDDEAKVKSVFINSHTADVFLIFPLKEDIDESVIEPDHRYDN